MQDLAVANSDSRDVSMMLRACAPTPTSATSRKNHPPIGSFDVVLPLSGSIGVECRTGGSTRDYTIVVAFSSSVTVMGNPQAEVLWDQLPWVAGGHLTAVLSL